MCNKQLVTVIMSTYNETLPQVRESVESILKQSYRNIEFLIVIDNPDNEQVKNYLYSIEDNRVKIICNERNIGLVNSLNKALKQVNGSLIARMDADDISTEYRIENQVAYIEKNKIDMVGTFVQLIDETGNVTKEVMKFPVKFSHICFFQRWGSCLCHPTWMVRKEVYDELNGYRDVPSCEDYDFIIRAIENEFCLGNVPIIGLKYRGRATGISKSNAIKQYILREYLSRAYQGKRKLSQDDIYTYLESNAYKRDINIENKYRESKYAMKNMKNQKAVKNFFCLLFKRCFWRDITEKAFLIIRENF